LYFTDKLINYLVKYSGFIIMSSDNDRLSQTFAALANTTRRAILARLAEGEATVNELAAPFNMSLPAISKHIKVLERAGLIIQGQKAQYRPCTINVTPLKEISNWTEQYRPIWEARFDRMDDYINQLNIKEIKNE
jgi:DNA-binding transcriptional ArsR family regulator